MSDYNNKLVPISISSVKENLSLILSNNIPVWRKNKNDQFMPVPLDRLEQFLGNVDHSYYFYIENKWESLIKTEVVEKIEPKKSPGFSWVGDEENSSIDTYTARRQKYMEMSLEEREEHLSNLLDIVKDIEIPKKTIDSDSIVTLINSLSEAFVITKSSFEDFSSEAGVPPHHIKKIALGTTILVKSVMEIVRNNKTVSNFLNLLGEKSTGSTVDHMNSVFLIYVAFCYFYNSYFSEGKIARLRSDYKKKFQHYYTNLPLETAPDSLEDVFKGGMRELDGDNLLQYGIGALLHDIGKVDNIDYFEGGDKYDRKVIMRHAPVSYNMIIKTREFDPIVAYLAALHHEYYNDKSGYGLSKLLFPEDVKKIKTPYYCLAYDLEEVKAGYAIAYVPAKMLEIVDVFDALTDKKRKYREREFTVDEALEIMKNDFIEKSLKLDPILFSIFVDFVNNNAMLKDKTLIPKLLGR
ncbi:MAG TPA: HD domain-containing protein [Spirochaetota bacterium]|nr:HD domain-containing protein [Spirochaetota bacterium]